MGIQSYSMRKFSFQEALRMTRELGLEYVEAFPMHLPYFAPPEKWRESARMIADSGRKLIAYGVVSFGRDEKNARQVFEFAKAMGIEVITADPEPASFGFLNRLCEEFKIPIAIHNHGPGSRYDTIRSIEEAMRGQPRWIGACIDTAHLLRSGENPVEAVRRFGKERVHAVHIKDVKDRTQYTRLGKGDLDMVGFLRALRQIDFKGSFALEYEEEPDEPMPALRECLQALQEAVRRM